MSGVGDRELMAMLAGVSRSFVITIRALPKGLRRPIGLAYLLARTSDTIADTATAPVDARIAALGEFSSGKVVTGLDAIAPDSPAERQLLKDAGRIFGAVAGLPEGDQMEIHTLLERITRGQALDLTRFPDAAQVRALETADELDEYTYLVAGCVGEFWTRICAAHIPRYSRIDLAALSALGRAFGQGLQLVNILRDIPEDLRNGRCYLPMSELRAAGIATTADVSAELTRAQPVFESWRRKALQYHGHAREYIEAIRPLRIRFACLIPWALGVRTLEMIGASSPLMSSQRIKVRRPEVSRIMRRAVWAALSNGAIQRWSAGLDGRTAK